MAFGYSQFSYQALEFAKFCPAAVASNTVSAHQRCDTVRYGYEIRTIKPLIDLGVGGFGSRPEHEHVKPDWFLSINVKSGEILPFIGL